MLAFSGFTYCLFISSSQDWCLAFLFYSQKNESTCVFSNICVLPLTLYSYLNFSFKFCVLYLGFPPNHLKLDGHKIIFYVCLETDSLFQFPHFGQEHCFSFPQDLHFDLVFSYATQSFGSLGGKTLHVFQAAAFHFVPIDCSSSEKNLRDAQSLGGQGMRESMNELSAFL